MYIEPIAYLALVLIGGALCLFGRRPAIESNLIDLSTVVLFIVYVSILRLSEQRLDIFTYVRSMHYETFSLYFVKEPFFWIGSRYLLDVFSDPFVVFWCYDVFSVAVVVFATRKIGLPHYFSFLFLLSFPSVMGVNNIYRQYLSSCLVLLYIAYNLTKRTPYKSSFLLVLSMLAHNASAMFLPHFFMTFRGRFRVIGFLFSSVAVILLVFFGASMKSYSSTGSTSPIHFIAYLIFLFVVFLLLNVGRNGSELKSEGSLMCFFIVLVILSIFVTGQAQVKRIAMYSVLYSFVPLAQSIERKGKSKPLLRLLLFCIGISPVLLFENARNMIVDKI